MITQRAWHGTLKSFKQFNLKHGSPYSMCGRGYYFTDSIDDAITYTKKKHGDVKDKFSNRITTYLERGMTRYRAEKKAEEMYSSPRVIEVELSIRNPLHIWNYDSTEYVQRKSLARVNRVLALNRQDKYTDQYDNELRNGLLEGVNTSELYTLMYHCGYSIFPKLVRALGYDAIIMHNTCEWWPMWYENNCNHYIVYHRSQIKKISESSELCLTDEEVLV